MYGIAESPILGLGSDGSLSYANGRAALQAQSGLGVDTSAGQQRRLVGRGIESHSLALDSWVKTGPLGVLPWIIVVTLVVRVLLRPLAQDWEPLRPLLAVWGVLTTWDLLFSPWSAHYELV